MQYVENILKELSCGFRKDEAVKNKDGRLTVRSKLQEHNSDYLVGQQD